MDNDRENTEGALRRQIKDLKKKKKKKKERRKKKEKKKNGAWRH
jgi:hypothetical protein